MDMDEIGRFLRQQDRVRREWERRDKDGAIEWDPAGAETFESTGRYDVGMAVLAYPGSEVTG